MAPPESSGEAGFALLELLVAIAILAGALAALSYGSAQALRTQAKAEIQTAAVQKARAVLATIGRTSPLQPGEQ